MSRIAAALLIVVVALAATDGLVHPAFADGLTARPSSGVEIAQPLVVRNGRVLALLLALEALRQLPGPAIAPKG